MCDTCQEELIEIAYSINVEVREQLEEEYVRCTVHDDGFITEFYFCGIPIWDSESDDRLYIDEENDIREDMETHLRRRIMEELKSLSDIHLGSSFIFKDINTNKAIDDNDSIKIEEGLVSYRNTEYYINIDLLKEHGLGKKDLDTIVDLHVEKLSIFELMDKTDIVNELKQYAKLVEAIEYKLQSIWGFDCDRSYHEWYLVPKCKCPVLDNRERRGTEYQIIHSDCPIHGK